MDKRYLKIYSSQNDYNNNWLNDLEVPHVVYIEETDEVIFKDADTKVFYSTQYFTLEALENGTMEIAMPNSFSSFKYAHNDGDWIQSNNAISLNVNTNDTVKIACVTDSYNSPFNCTCKFNVHGNVMSLLYGDDFIGQTNLEGKNNCFDSLFMNNTNLLSAENLVLPATTLANYCYSHMFLGCTSLTTAPELPATTLADQCYNYMFNGCSKLNYIKALFTTYPNIGLSTNNWVSGVASNGTFVKNANATWDVTGDNGIPNGWTVETV